MSSVPREQMRRQAKRADRLLERLAKKRDKKLGLDPTTRHLPTQIRLQAVEADRMMAEEAKKLNRRPARANRLIHPGTGVADINTDYPDDLIQRLEREGRSEEANKVREKKRKKEEEEMRIKNAVESILPNAWPEFKTICTMAIGIKNIADENKTARIRQGVRGAIPKVQRARKAIKKLAPAVRRLLPSDSDDTLDQIVSVLSNAYSELDELPDGKQPREHRDYLAREIAELMRQHGIEPRALGDHCNSDDVRTSWEGDDRFAQLVRRAIILVEGRQPQDVRPILRRALRPRDDGVVSPRIMRGENAP